MSNDADKEKIIIFLRHGESEKNIMNIVTSDVIEKYPLTEKGRGQAEFAAKELRKLLDIAKFYTSPILRARETAEIVSRSFDLSPIIDYRLGERGTGILEGKEEPKDPEWKFDKNNKIEPWNDVVAKMISFMGDANGKVIVAITHGDNMAAACDSIDHFGERLHTRKIPSNCHFTIIDFKNMRIISKDTDNISEDLRR